MLHHGNDIFGQHIAKDKLLVNASRAGESRVEHFWVIRGQNDNPTRRFHHSIQDVQESGEVQAIRFNGRYRC